MCSKSRKLSEIRFVPPRLGQNLWRDKGVLVRLDVAKLDKAWRYNRVPRGGGRDPETRFKYDGVRKWIGSGKKVDLWATTVATEDEEDAVCFIEGRHSFAVLRDLGYMTIEAWVTRDEADEFVRKYGAK
jgi:hypothetical protein